MSDPTRPAIERELAWRAHLEVATRTPFLGVTPGRDPDCLVGEAVYDSLAVHNALHKLAAAITPDSPLVPTLLPALMASRRLLSLRSSWTGYCNERFALEAAATDKTSEMSRQYVDGDAVRAWPQFNEAQAAYDEAKAAIGDVEQVLARFRGPDSVTSTEAEPERQGAGLRLVPGTAGGR
ncbi:hypothetical protein [Streptomyces sp. NBC_00239]|uniref:hypothetical protein n=1 Tax=Streptomyces sp. NBC_00239 TaxID=2903640 RepID=UPI002E27BA82|nr:hypothetical protein [Streptomyces sp. NBC_00239]